MRRVNIRAAFAGEPSHASEPSAQDESDEAVVLQVRGGEVCVIVPRDTDDALVLDRAGTIRGSLHLENERVLTFEIQDDSVGAFFEHESARLHYRRQESGGLFAIKSERFGPPGAAVRARDVMRTEVVTIPPDKTIEEVASLLTFHRVSGLPVVDGERLVGIVSEADVIAKQGRVAADIMTREVATVREETAAEQVVDLLTQRRIRRVPVVCDGRLVGIISRGDIMRWVASRRPAAHASTS